MHCRWHGPFLTHRQVLYGLLQSEKQCPSVLGNFLSSIYFVLFLDLLLARHWLIFFPFPVLCFLFCFCIAIHGRFLNSLTLSFNSFFFNLRYFNFRDLLFSDCFLFNAYGFVYWSPDFSLKPIKEHWLLKFKIVFCFLHCFCFFLPNIFPFFLVGDFS